MKKLQFKTSIKAPVGKVYRTMLGLDSKADYEAWTAGFNPTSTYEGSWEKGSKTLFIGTGEDGKKGGMVSEIAEHIPNRFVSIRHNGILDGDKEITSGEQAAQWAGGFENYTFEENNGVTDLTVDLETADDYFDYFNQTWPKVLEKLKQIIENN